MPETAETPIPSEPLHDPNKWTVTFNERAEMVAKEKEEKTKRLQYSLTKGSLSEKDMEALSTVSTIIGGPHGGRMTNWELLNVTRTFHGGYHIRKGHFLQKMYGCHTCPLRGVPKEQNGCPHDIKKNEMHVNGGCSARYQRVVHWLKQARGDSIPLMQEQIWRLKFVSDEMYEKDMRKYGTPSETWVRLQKVISDITYKYEKALHGVRMSIEKKVTYDDLRRTIINAKAKVLE